MLRSYTVHLTEKLSLHQHLEPGEHLWSWWLPLRTLVAPRITPYSSVNNTGFGIELQNHTIALQTCSFYETVPALELTQNLLLTEPGLKEPSNKLILPNKTCQIPQEADLYAFLF